MWREMARIIHEVRPRFVFVENSPMLTSRGLGVVLGDLAQMGFDARWGVLGAADVGAPHQRDRIWIGAKWGNIFPHTKLHGARWREQQSKGIEEAQGNVANPKNTKRGGRLLWGENEDIGTQRDNQPGGSGQDVDNACVRRHWAQEEQVRSRGNGPQHTSWWEVEPDVGRVAHGVAARVDRLKAIGNGQVPEVARRAWEELSA